MIILSKVLNEQNQVGRVMGNIHEEDWVDRIVVIDGCSTDYTVEELKKYPKVQVFQHPWIDSYFAMEVAQSNIGLSYIPQGATVFILDFDERVSPELKGILKALNEKGLPADVGNVPRKTVEPLRHEGSPFAMIGDDGWPIISHQIGQYPDRQVRILRKDYRMRWVNSPHHILMGWEGTTQFDTQEGADIIHYEKDDYRDRQRIERKWARAVAMRKKLGLPPDIHEVGIHPDVHKYSKPEEWE